MICTRCGKSAEPFISWLHKEPLCISCNGTCCYFCSRWRPYDQMYEDPDSSGECSVTNNPTDSYETCNNFKELQ